MKSLPLLATLTLGLASCGINGDPIANGIGIRNISTITGESCTKLEATIRHAGQEISISDTATAESTARLRVQRGASLNVNAKCTYTNTTVVNDKPVTETKTETLFANRTVLEGGDIYITTTSTPTGRRLLIAETINATPAVIRATADSSACDKFEATITGSGTDQPLTLSTVQPQNVGYFSTAKPLTITATCTGVAPSEEEEAPVTTLDEDITLSGNTQLAISSSTGPDGKPRLSITAQ